MPFPCICQRPVAILAKRGREICVDDLAIEESWVTAGEVLEIGDDRESAGGPIGAEASDGDSREAVFHASPF
jgi:hypothetical protein